MAFPATPILVGLRLRGGFFVGSGAGISPRLIARLICCCSFFCFPDIGLRRGMF